MNNLDQKAVMFRFGSRSLTVVVIGQIATLWFGTIKIGDQFPIAEAQTAMELAAQAAYSAEIGRLLS